MINNNYNYTFINKIEDMSIKLENFADLFKYNKELFDDDYNGG